MWKNCLKAKAALGMIDYLKNLKDGIKRDLKTFTWQIKEIKEKYGKVYNYTDIDVNASFLNTDSLKLCIQRE